MKKEPQRIQKKYVLKSDERMPSKGNFWGIEAAFSAEEAQKNFRDRITTFRALKTAFTHEKAMEKDRHRRIAEDDFEVELL